MECIYLVGCPNVGKSTLFTSLTGRYARAGNREGVTVDALTVSTRLGGRTVRLTDLPGIRTLPPQAPDERISVSALEDAPGGAVVLFVADAGRLAEGLSLFFDLRGQVDRARSAPRARSTPHARSTPGARSAPGARGAEALRWVLAVNGCDRLVPSDEGTDAPGRVLDAELLSALCGVPAVGVSALRRWGLRELTRLLLDGASAPTDGGTTRRMQPSGCGMVCGGCAGGCPSAGRRSAGQLRAGRTPSPDAIAAKVLRGRVPDGSVWRDKADRLLTRPLTGLPILLLLWGLLMFLAFGTPGTRLCALCEAQLALFGAWAAEAADGLPLPVRSLLCEGILGGVGAVLSFLPRLFLLWVGMAVLEETGYLPRGARLADPFMRRLGLSGQALIPLLLGFGCTVPAVMTTRTIADGTVRGRVIRLAPLVTCSARMPLFSLLAEAFFANGSGGLSQPWRIFCFCAGMYALSAGVVLAVAAAGAWLSRCRGRAAGERADVGSAPLPDARPLPPLRVPSLSAILSETVERLRQFLGRVGGVILLSSVLVWLLLHITPRFDWLFEPDDTCLLYRMGGWLGWLLRPLGLAHPAVAAALLAGVGAKESIVSVLGICLSVGQGQPGSLAAALAGSGWLTAGSALSLAVFSAFYMPCTAALGAIGSEWVGKKRYMLLSLLLSFLLAYGLAFLAGKMV